MIRLFVGLELPFTVRDRLADLAEGLPGARWVAPELFHLTLRFIGEVAGRTADEIDAALEGVKAPAFRMALAGVGVFGGADPHTLWAGVVANPALAGLAQRVETALRRAGVAPETRRFQPHVTLARLRGTPQEKLAAYVMRHNLFGTEEFPVTGMTLFSSHPGGEGPHYEAERVYPLRAA